MPVVEGDIYVAMRDANFSEDLATSIARMPVDVDAKLRVLRTEVIIWRSFTIGASALVLLSCILSR